MSDVAKCPERELFVGFLQGGLEEDVVSKLEAHLAECDACGDTVRSLNVNDTFSDLVRSAQEKAVSSSDDSTPSEIDGLLGRLEALADPQTVDDKLDASKDDLQDRVQEVELLLQPAHRDDEIGRLAHYRIIRLLGAGGMGVVYQAEDTQLKRLVALKILRPSLGQSARDRFVQEAQVAAAIDHDNVVTIYHVGREGRLAFLAMQWLEGETLEDRLKRDGRLCPDEASLIAGQVADGLAAAHAKKLIHRDIKPANIWLEADRNRAKILDFGLAQIVDDDPQLTETGMIAGTPAYMSPEQAQGRSVDERSDLFSLGTMLYRMLTNKLPFDSKNALATIRSIQLDHPDSPRQIDMSIPSTLSDTVMHLLEKDPRDRPESSALVASCLQSKKRPPHSTAERVRPQASVKPNRGAWWGGGMVATLLLGMAGYFAAPTIYRVVTDSGEITVKSDDPNVKVEVLQGGEVLRVIDTATSDSVTVRSGKYELRLKGKASGLTIEPDKITLRRNDVETASIVRQTNGVGVANTVAGLASHAANALVNNASASGNEATSNNVAASGVDRKDEKRLRLNFDNAPWKDVLEWYANEADLSFNLDNTPRGTWSISSQNAYSVQETLSEINGRLLPLGYTLLRSGTHLYLLDLSEDTDRQVISDLVKETNPRAVHSLGRFELAKVTFDLKSVDADAAASELLSLIGPYGQLFAVPSTKQLVITDFGEKIQTVRSALLRMESLASQDATEPTDYQILDEMEKDPRYMALLNKIDDYSDQVDAERRNSPDSPLVKQGTAEVMRLQLKREKLYEELEPRIRARLQARAANPNSPLANVASPSEPAKVQLLRLKYETSEEMKRKLDELLSATGLQVVSSPSSNSIVLRGAESAIEQAFVLVRELDVPPVPAPKTLPTEATYDGRSYAEWMAVLKTEKSRSVLGDAIAAVTTLASKETSPEICAALVPILRKHGNAQLNFTEEVNCQTNLGLRQLDQQTVAAFVRDELKAGNSRSRAFLLSLLKLWSGDSRRTESEVMKKGTEFWAAMAPLTSDLSEYLVEVSEQEATTDWAVEVLVALIRSVPNASEEVGVIDQVVHLLEQRLKTERNATAAMRLAESISLLDYKSKALSGWLANAIKRGPPSDHVRLIAIASKMKERAEVAVPSFVEIARECADIRLSANGNRVAHAGPKAMELVNALGDIGAKLDRRSESAQMIVALLKELTSEDLVDTNGKAIKEVAAEALAKMKAEQANGEP